MPRTQVLGNDQIQRLPDRFPLRETEDARRAGIPEGDDFTTVIDTLLQVLINLTEKIDRAVSSKAGIGQLLHGPILPDAAVDQTEIIIAFAIRIVEPGFILISIGN